jgi:hypothetical protein
MVKTIIAYFLVVPLVQFCLTAGVILAGLLVALFLAWAPISLRTKVGGACGGIAGVALPVAFGYGIFRLIVGPGSFTIGPFLASTLPLLIPIWNDILQSGRVNASREELLASFADSCDEATMSAVADSTTTSHGSSVVGEIVGLGLATAWFFWW